MTVANPGLAFRQRETRIPCDPLEPQCANCLWNLQTMQEAALQRQGGNVVEVLGGKKPCLREMERQAAQAREMTRLEQEARA